jgi:hypothetical protein
LLHSPALAGYLVNGVRPDMIILKHLTIERFRLLRSLNLHFPQRGSILIQGPNEAGKSALVESIYFALYGEPLVTLRNHSSLDDLILYGSNSATIALSLSLGATELSITRAIERGSGQQASLVFHHLGQPDDAPITRLEQVNASIISALGNIDKETLRNSELIEQKGLTRLESISGSDREATVRKLLGMDSLATLSAQFQPGPADDEALHASRERLHLAEIQDRIPQVDAQLTQIESALAAVSINELLADVDQQESEIAELEQSLEDISQRRQELKSSQGRIHQLKRADSTLSDIIASYDEIAEARRTLPVLEQDIADLERREREELPKIEKRVNELAELSRSYGTVERMANDLLSAVDTIHSLEQKVHDHVDVQQDLRNLDAQVHQARERVEQVQQQWVELEEQRRSSRPLLEDRLQRLRFLAGRLTELRQLDEHYTNRVSGRAQSEESAGKLVRVSHELQDTEQELELAEDDAQQAQQRATVLENSWRQVNIRHQVEEWSRQKGIAQGLAQAEQNVNLARQRQGELTNSWDQVRRAVTPYVIFLALSAAASLFLLIFASINFASNIGIAIISLVLMFVVAGLGFWLFRRYQALRSQERVLKSQEQEAISHVGSMVAAREAATRMVGSKDGLAKIEHEILALGGNVPRSLEDARQFLDRTSAPSDTDALQQQLHASADEANALHSRVAAIKESLQTLHDEQSGLEDLRKREHWDTLESDLRADEHSIGLMHQELILLAGQEGLPMPSINARIQASPIPSEQSFASGPLTPINVEDDVSGIPALEGLVDSTIKATEHEIASLDGKLDLASDLARQMRTQQDALDKLLERQSALHTRDAQYQLEHPEQQLESARVQQSELSGALQSLKDSLRQRVQPLGITHGQSSVGNAENAARKQLEELHITLGNKIMLQERQKYFTDVLRDRQDALSEYYKQLAKFSNSLGSWIVPLNPFAEALATLRTRCQNEIQEANEDGILKDLDALSNQEGASNAKIQLCREVIATDQDAMTDLLVQRDQLNITGYQRQDLIATWPLLSQYTPDDRSGLEDEQRTLQGELTDLRQQELTLREQLGLDEKPLDLAATRQSLEVQERAYDIKKHGNQLLREVEERLLRKVQPRTEYYMQQILPLLTGGRYHDVHLLTEPDEETLSGGPFQIQVWDTAASAYVPSASLSGGAADQLSLALRLAFAIATLPRDLNAAPGFVVLDEPLSSFDRGRAQALVDVVTGEVLSNHFEQVILLSHSSAFDPAMFPYHLYMDNGLIVESNLPSVQSALPAALDQHSLVPVTPLPDAFDADEDATVAIAAIKLPFEKL